MNHCLTILNELIKGKNEGVHSFDLVKRCKTTSIDQSIRDLKKQGYMISSRPEPRGNSVGCRYFLLNTTKPHYDHVVIENKAYRVPVTAI